MELVTTNMPQNYLFLGDQGSARFTNFYELYQSLFFTDELHILG